MPSLQKSARFAVCWAGLELGMRISYTARERVFVGVKELETFVELETASGDPCFELRKSKVVVVRNSIESLDAFRPS